MDKTLLAYATVLEFQWKKHFNLNPLIISIKQYKANVPQESNLIWWVDPVAGNRHRSPSQRKKEFVPTLAPQDLSYSSATYPGA